jgi:hypothetical protein
MFRFAGDQERCRRRLSKEMLVPEENRPAESRREETGKADERRGRDSGNKSAVDKAIDKAQEKGWTEKAANIVKGRLKGR